MKNQNASDIGDNMAVVLTVSVVFGLTAWLVGKALSLLPAAPSPVVAPALGLKVTEVKQFETTFLQPAK